MLYRGMDRAQLDAAYNNSAAVPDRDAIVADWVARSAKVRREYTGHFDLGYGDTPRERLDLFLSSDPKVAPTLAFIHGGYWQMNDKENFAFFVEGSRDVCAGRWNLDVPPQSVRAVDERTFRGWLGQNAFRVTGIVRGEVIG